MKLGDIAPVLPVLPAIPDGPVSKLVRFNAISTAEKLNNFMEACKVGQAICYEDKSTSLPEKPLLKGVGHVGFE